MPIRRSKPFTFKPKGVTDTVDGTNSEAGSMQSLQNLTLNASTNDTWVPRPGSVQLTAFASFNTPGFVSALFTVGDLAYGMIASGRNPGKDEPFVYNLLLNTFETVTGITAANTPTSPATSGDWTPPIMQVIGSKIVVTHPGFAGGAPGFFFGWFDISGFTDATKTGTTHSSTLIDTLSANVLQAGWTVGMTITGTNIPAGTFIRSIAADGLSLVMSAAATDSVALKALTVAGGTAASPLWAAGNTNGNPLIAVPVSVSQMAGRAYFAVGNGVVLSDSGSATQVTNADQVLLFNNGVPVTALGQLALSSPITGGIIQSILAFQGVTAIQSITGDPTTTNLAVNIIKAGTGTLSPLSIVSFNDGTAFVSPQGLRVVTFSATVSNPVGDHGTGVAIPFIYAIAPSRICAAANADRLRISVQNGFANGQPMQEYWLSISRKVWSGPHTFPASLIQPWGSTFVMVANGINAKLWQSDTDPSVSSTYTENGAPMTFVYWTSLLPDNQSMAMNAIVETTIAAAFPATTSVNVSALDDNASVLDTVNMIGTGTATTWGAFTWGAAPWSTGSGIFRQRSIQWHVPIVFKQGTIQITGTSLFSLILGNIYIRHQELGYTIELGP